MDPDTVWSRFNAGRAGMVHWYGSVLKRLDEIGFSAPIVEELRDAVTALEQQP
jgi:hypothetical protein